MCHPVCVYLLYTHENRPKFSPPCLPLSELAAGADAATSMIDSSASLLSRQFDRDVNAVLRRAAEGGVSGIIVSCTDFSRAEEVLKLCAQWPSQLYACVGVSPDVIKKNHDKLFEQRMEKLEDYALQQDTVAIRSAHTTHAHATKQPAHFYTALCSCHAQWDFCMAASEWHSVPSVLALHDCSALEQCVSMLDS